MTQDKFSAIEKMSPLTIFSPIKYIQYTILTMHSKNVFKKAPGHVGNLKSNKC
jgi:hypothetical protein